LRVVPDVAFSRARNSAYPQESPQVNSNTVRAALCAALALALGAAAPARAAAEHADEGGAGTVYSKAEYPYAELVRQPLTLARGLFRLELPVRINLSKDEVGEPTSIPASLDFGVTDDLQIGVFHANGICLNEGAGGECEDVYDDVGARVRYGLFRDPGGQLAIEAAVLAEDFGDLGLLGQLGLAYKRTIGNTALVVSAALATRLNERDAFGGDLVLGNADAELQLQLGEGVAAIAGIGALLPFNPPVGDVGDFFTVPVRFGLEWEPAARIDVGAELEFGNLLGNEATSDEREVTVFGRFFF
jgi:hypothetical protein